MYGEDVCKDMRIEMACKMISFLRATTMAARIFLHCQVSMGLTNMWSPEFVVARLLGILPMEPDLECDAVGETREFGAEIAFSFNLCQF